MEQQMLKDKVAIMTGTFLESLGPFGHSRLQQRWAFGRSVSPFFASDGWKYS